MPETLKKSSKIEKSQIRLIESEKEHLAMAKKMEIANIFNIRAVLRYYERRGNDKELSLIIKEIGEIIKAVNESKAVNSLMMLEAQARQKYYRAFNYIIKNEDFKFIKRTRRPPKDALNAMISFGNTLLYQRFASLIYQSSMDIRFGILHNSDYRSESLNLDLADIFKPILVDRTIFTIINKKMISLAEGFRGIDSDGVYLSPDGKRIFIKEFDKKINQKIKIRNVHKTYDQIMKDEIKKLAKYFKDGTVYKPYKYVN